MNFETDWRMMMSNHMGAPSGAEGGRSGPLVEEAAVTAVASMRRVTHVQAADERNIYIHFAVIDDRGATHFHFRIDKEPFFADEGWFSCAGVETHYASPPDYMSEDKPSHERCWLIERPCWHDGTSLWASEHWLPHFKSFGTEWVWSELERAHSRRFGDASRNRSSDDKGEPAARPPREADPKR